MATISPNDSAPAGSIHYTFAGAEFELGGRKKKYETDDADVVANAEAHPWLTVTHTAEQDETPEADSGSETPDEKVKD